MRLFGRSQEPITAGEKYSRGTLHGSVDPCTVHIRDGPKPRPAKGCRRPFQCATTGSSTSLTLLFAVDTSCLRKAQAPRDDLARATIVMRIRVTDGIIPDSLGIAPNHHKVRALPVRQVRWRGNRLLCIPQATRAFGIATPGNFQLAAEAVD